MRQQRLNSNSAIKLVQNRWKATTIPAIRPNPCYLQIGDELLRIVAEEVGKSAASRFGIRLKILYITRLPTVEQTEKSGSFRSSSARSGNKREHHKINYS
jgi:hypothetical protein